ncbi:ornithine decarboxylase-like isoform X2 [Ambystoma mexicanum]|uniref:ornithine decarboxylase-like isoform X2 n=1 Tax=Ambystoma mexicanum TaxID=8296 RepID=UPI0037E74470
MLDFTGSALLEEGVTARVFLDRLIQESQGTDDTDAFFVADLGDVVKKHLHFLKALPRVTPFYAVKCNSSPEVVRTLAQLGTGFDCASKTELELVQGFGVPPDRIIYANPCKQLSHIQHAAKTGVTMMTFDSESELDKVSSSHPDARMILRIVADDSRATLALSPKFGAELSACRHLLEVAKRLRVEVIGVSFHVGSVSIDPQTFAQSIADAGMVFSLGKELGHDMHLLDIGGGFPGSADYYEEFEKISAVINTALDKHFPEGCGVEVVAEPGRYYVASAFILAVNIIGKKELPLEETGLDGARNSGSKNFEYYLNDGMYGSFFHVSFEKPVLNPSPHKLIQNRTARLILGLKPGLGSLQR